MVLCRSLVVLHPFHLCVVVSLIIVDIRWCREVSKFAIEVVANNMASSFFDIRNATCLQKTTFLGNLGQERFCIAKLSDAVELEELISINSV